MAYDSSLIVYTGVSLIGINVTAGTTLETALQNINTAIITVGPSPAYGSYNYTYSGYTIHNTSGGSITTVQQFAEGISKAVCVLESDFYTFRDTTYVANQSAISSSLSALVTPGLTYSYSGGGGSISITNGMTRNQVLTATYTGVGNILALLNAPGSTWGTLSISTPTNINSAFNSLITYLSTTSTTIAGKQNSLGTFNTTAIGGGATDSPITTITTLISYSATLQTKAVSTVTATYVIPTAATVLGWIQGLNNTMDTNLTDRVVSVTGGIVVTASTPGTGKTIGIDTSWANYGKVKATSGGAVGFLDAKIVAGTNISVAVVGDQLQINSVAQTNKVLVNSLDVTPGYLSDKIGAGNDSSWSLGIIQTVDTENSKLTHTPAITNPNTFITTLFNYISTDPDLLSKLTSLIAETTNITCAAPTALVVTITFASNYFNLAWALGAGSVSQLASYRSRGTETWLTSNILGTGSYNVPNPQANTTTVARASGLAKNTVYQFQITNNCTTGSSYSNIYEAIIYTQQTLTYGATSGVISVNQAALPTIDTVEYMLYRGASPLETVLATGLNPSAKFASVSSGTYTVKFRYTTLINGSSLSSDDSSESAAWYTYGSSIIIP